MPVITTRLGAILTLYLSLRLQFLDPPREPLQLVLEAAQILARRQPHPLDCLDHLRRGVGRGLAGLLAPPRDRLARLAAAPRNLVEKLAGLPARLGGRAAGRLEGALDRLPQALRQAQLGAVLGRLLGHPDSLLRVAAPHRHRSCLGRLLLLQRGEELLALDRELRRR